MSAYLAPALTILLLLIGTRCITGRWWWEPYEGDE